MPDTPVQNCTPNDTSSQICSVANGTGEETRICPADGADWGNYGICEVLSCNNGYHKDGNTCVQTPPDQVCTPNSPDTRSCSISNGTGQETRLCLASGLAYGSYGDCEVQSCDSGYEQSGNSCIEDAVAIPVPQNLRAINGTHHTVNLVWDDISDANDYELVLDEIGGSDDRTIETSIFIHIFNDLLLGHEYRFKVKAKVGTNYGGYSGYKNFTVYCPLNMFANNQITESLSNGDWDINVGGSKTQVKQLQRFLSFLGYNIGTSGADGKFGDDTESAVRAYQSVKGIGVDGQVGPETRATINSTCD